MAIEKTQKEQDTTTLEAAIEAAGPLTHSQINGLEGPTAQMGAPSLVGRTSVLPPMSVVNPATQGHNHLVPQAGTSPAHMLFAIWACVKG